MAKFSAVAETVSITFTSSAVVAFIFVTLTLTGPLNSAPCGVVNSTANATNTSTVVLDPLWRMVTGAKVSSNYAFNQVSVTIQGDGCPCIILS